MAYRRLVEITSSQELTFVQLSLREAGVDFQVRNELTLRTAEVYALGMHGAIVAVIPADYERAKAVLFDLGIVVDYDTTKDQFSFVRGLDEQTQNLPFIGTQPIAVRILLIFGLLASGFAYFLIYLHTRVYVADLTAKSWCVERVVNDGIGYSPHTVAQYSLYWPGRCPEQLYFQQEQVALPGINSRSVFGEWRRRSHSEIQFVNLDTLATIYVGTYTIHASLLGNVELRAAKTQLFLSQ